MKIRISDLSDRGLQIEDQVPLQPLNERLNSGSDTGIVFTAAPKVSIKVRRAAQGAETTGTVVAPYRQSCGRCLDPVDREITIRADFIVKHRPEKVSASELPDDVGILYFDGEHLDLEPALQESLILALSLYWCAPLDKAGKCTGCARQVTGLAPKPAEKSSAPLQLGELLKRAGVNK